MKQRPVAGPVGERQRQRHVALAEPLGIAVDVEHLGVGEQPAPGVTDEREHLGRGDVLGDDDGDVLAHVGEAAELAVGRDRGLGHGIEVELEPGDGVA